uniref:Uncharacterized protein n=1 Tax=Setaria viridis TaxID=4556 RepID=A0A4U6WDC5_SETVI|nr:hypothetical protein SEVIR_1G153550v2 [Setaria viridis]
MTQDVILGMKSKNPKFVGVFFLQIGFISYIYR